MTTTRPSPARTPLPVAASKVPGITLAFWVTKVLTTGMGETASDWLAHGPGPVVAVAVGSLGVTVALTLQLRTDRYVPWVYWLAVSMVSVFGTVAADVLHVGLGVPYAVSTVFFGLGLALVLLLWHRVEGTLSIHGIRTCRREAFYWATVLATFALGTAAGDLTAVTLDLGYLGSGLLFCAVIAVPALAHRAGLLAAVPAFWAAYVVTRPLGASFADWAGRATDHRGLGLGTGSVTLGLCVFITVSVAYLTVSRLGEEPLAG